MLAYRTPGVYIEEISTGPRPIEAVGTSTAGFVGVAPNSDAHPNEAVPINSWSQFVKEYAPGGNEPSTPLAQAVFGFFQNGGSRCYVSNIKDEGGIIGSGRERRGLDLFEEIDEIALVAAPGLTSIATSDALLSHCETLKDRFAILDPPRDVLNIDLLTKVASAPIPDAADDSAEGNEGARKKKSTKPEGLRPRSSQGGYGAFYFPWIMIRDPLGREVVTAPPSGHMAGIYARTDATRGVHKAPANEVVRGALNITYRVTRAEQGELNEAGVNCIRSFPRQGILVWGARTLDDSGEWRYINVRRLFNMVEESISRSTLWVVFEPNDESLWKAIRRDIGAFLRLLWSQGALMGSTPEEAFFVQCDAETNPPEVIDAGRVVTRIGMAPVKPAEFVVFEIGQSAAGTQIETAGR